jgi:pyruvate,water dikinase
MSHVVTPEQAVSMTDATWTPPGPGSWVCDRSHTPPAPTLVYRRIIGEHTAPAYREVFETFGAALDTVDMKVVNGAMFRRLVPLFGADRDRGKVPPSPILWLATRLHPTMRRRNRAATRALATRSFLGDIEHWLETERFEWIEASRQLQAIDVTGLTDGDLADHLRALDQLLIRGWRRHHQLHAQDLGPIGDLLAHGQDWGLDTTEVMALLKGASPATTSAAAHGRAIAEALDGSGVDPAGVTSIDQIRSVPEAATALDEYLDLFGWRLISDYDIEGLTLHELPGAVVAIVRRAAEEIRLSRDGETGRTEAERAQAERTMRDRAGDPELFDELLDSARRAYGVRDDNGPLTWAWPAGLTRRAYLEAATRLTSAGRLDEPAQVFELDIPELVATLNGSTSPSAAELAERARRRAWESTLEAPDVLGPAPVEPDLSPLPEGLRRLMNIIVAATTLLQPDPEASTTSLTGLGIGTEPYRGTARVADDPTAAVSEMQPGDVLVAPWTAPSFNAVFAIAGGVVVQEGGLLCHAAVMARELGVPTVVGCVDAMTQITSGDQVEVDPVAGRVTVLARP